MRVIYDLSRDGLSAINTAASEMESARQQVASGRRINSPSDDPLGTQQDVSQYATVASIDSYTSSGDSASARLSTVDNVLNGVVDKLTQSIVSGTSARGSNVDATARAAASANVRSLRDSLASDLNTQYQGSYLFSGTNVTQPAYVQVGGVWTYQGNAQTTQVEVQQGQLVSTTFNGQAIAQGTASTDVLTTLDNLANAIDAGDDTGVGNALTSLDAAFDRATQAQGNLGASERTITDASASLSSLRSTATARSAKLEQADMPAAITRLTTAQNAYQAALSAVSSAERVSLLDYLPTT